MTFVRNWWLLGALLVPVIGIQASAQSDQFLPEIDAYYKLTSDVRIWFQAKETVEGGDPTTAEIGPTLDFYLKPSARLQQAAASNLDESKKRPIIFSIGYRYLPYPNAPPTNRLEPLVTLNFAMKGNLLLSDRNRGDLDWQSGSFSWRYRNRVQLERTLRIHSYHISPYASAEFFYESEYGKWSDTAIYAGCLFPFGRHINLNPYYEHQNNTGKSPNQQLNQLGLILNLFF